MQNVVASPQLMYDGDGRTELYVASVVKSIGISLRLSLISTDRKMICIWIKFYKKKKGGGGISIDMYLKQVL